MKTLSFNILKPFAFTALFIVFAASFNTAEAESHGCPSSDQHCKGPNDRCDSTPDCGAGYCCKKQNGLTKQCVYEANDCNE
ncbi:MAG: hypothetical protein CL816_00455 [Coxiellaceae bacterium]|nr:hypothetical protein [Coxiellaceae bacterium]